MKVSLFERGYCFERPRRIGRKSGGGKRGKLTGKVSSASFRRLRAWCVEHECSLSEAWGITLTVPGLELISVSDFKELHHKLCVFCNDNQFPLVWRVELQQRGQPHLHCVLFANASSAMRIVVEWYRLLSISKVYSVESVEEGNEIVDISRSFVNGSVHAVDLQKLSGDFRAWRYLVSHMSKGKQVQLGWAGRNWGVCNRRMFTNSNQVDLFPSDSVSACLIRSVRRLYNGAKPWPLLSTKGRKFHKRPFIVCGKRYMLGNPDLISRMYKYYSECETNGGGAIGDVHVRGTRPLFWLFSWFGLQFLESIPQGFFDFVEICTWCDCQAIKGELEQMSLQFWLWYDDVPF